MKRSFYLSCLLVVCMSMFSSKAGAQAVITADPINVTACNGSTQVFGSTATGATSYMWQVSTDGTSWDTVHASSFYSTVTDDTLTVHLDLSLDGHMYRVIAYATAGNDTSNAATLHVLVPSAGTITGPSAVCIGGHITFTSSVAGGTWMNVNHTIDTITAGGIDTGRTVGIDTIKYIATNTCGTDTAWTLVHVDAPLTPMAITGPTSVCKTGHITLANANAGGTWTSTNTARATVGLTSGVVSGVAPGVVAISYSVSNACNTVTAGYSITVEDTLNHGTVTGASTVCAGSWIHLVNSVGGGIWLSDSTSVAVVDGSGNVTGISGGTATISYYFSNSCGASFASHIVTVSVPAGAITGNDSVGIDSMLLLMNSTPGGTWTSSDTTIAAIRDTVIASGLSSATWIKGRDTGVVTITYTVTNDCGTSSVTTTVNVGPLPAKGTIEGPDSVCAGTTATYVDTTGGGVVTHWRNKWDTVGTISADGIYTPASFDDTSSLLFRTDTLFATVSSAFGNVVVKRVIVIAHLKLIAPGSISLGGSYALIGSPGGGTFTTSNSAMTPLIGYGFFVVLGSGTSVFTYSTALCGAQHVTDTVTLAGPSGVGNITNDHSLNIFPNPSNGSVMVNLASGLHEDATVTVTTVTGVKLQEVSIKTNTNNEIVIDQPTGMYVISATTASGKKYSANVNITK